MAKSSKAKKAGAAVGLAGRAWEYGKRVDWPAVWMRARWLSHHSQRLYNNLTPEERREFLDIVVPTRDSKMIAKDDRARVAELVSKAFSGSRRI
ncbi:MAG: hypothetical protein KDB48_01690 [Solirubrobacterales bacterium]|nr:hypothetical protein [Solirubrobacterales bacterium]HMT04576.1 hypothetical protein [Solirubrobacterales bacterium]